MSRAQIKTDNSYFEEKVRLRIDNLPAADPLIVLDMYAGTGRIWEEVRRRTGRNIKTLGIEKRKIDGRIYLRGDNEKFNLDFNRFHVIDVDAYGIPFLQLKNVFRKTRVPMTIFITFIRTCYGRLPDALLESLGFSRRMYRKIRAIFYYNGDQKFLCFLGNMGVRNIKLYRTSDGDKNYGCIKINENSTLQFKDKTSRIITRQKSK